MKKLSFLFFIILGGCSLGLETELANKASDNIADLAFENSAEEENKFVSAQNNTVDKSLSPNADKIVAEVEPEETFNLDRPLFSISFPAEYEIADFNSVTPLEEGAFPEFKYETISLQNDETSTENIAELLLKKSEERYSEECETTSSCPQNLESMELILDDKIGKKIVIEKRIEEDGRSENVREYQYWFLLGNEIYIFSSSVSVEEDYERYARAFDSLMSTIQFK